MTRPLRSYKIPAGGEYGANRAGGRTHHATDYHPLNNVDGQPIYGTGPGGVVTHIGYNPDPVLGLGHNVTVTYPGERVTIDGHMMQRTPLQVGSPVDQNTIIGYVGHTGNAVNASPPGSHDHHQMTINGALVDPENYYANEPAALNLTELTETEDMKLVLNTTYDQTGKVTGVLNYLVGEVTLKPLYSVSDIETATKLYGAATPINSPKWDMLVAMVNENKAALRSAAPTINYAELATEIAKLIPKPPTALENGNAARAAIVR